LKLFFCTKNRKSKNIDLAVFVIEGDEHKTLSLKGSDPESAMGLLNCRLLQLTEDLEKNSALAKQ
jgi:hypothetical protein